MTADERALLNAIIAAPEDDLPRLVYADWLEEHNRAEQAAVMRSEHHRAGGNADGYFHFGTHYPDLWERIVYLAGATPDLVASVRRGIVFLMAWWSGPALQAFAALAAALRASDPDGRLLVVVIDVDGISEEFSAEFEQEFRPYQVHLSGWGEALWVCRNRVIGATRAGTPGDELNWRVRGLLSPQCAEGPESAGGAGSIR
jgi:uncharacterized protein (TIGR02996 family)